MHNLYIPRLHFSYLKMDSYPGCVKCVQFSDAVRGKLVNSVRRGAGFDTWRWQHSCHADVGGSDRQKRNVASNRRMWRWRALAEWENQPFQLHQRREFYLQLLFFLSYIHIYFPPMVWCRQMTLLYIGPGYYLDGWLSVDRYTISVCNQPPRSTQPSIPPGWLMEYRPVWLGLRWGVFTCVGWKVTLCDNLFRSAISFNLFFFKSFSALLLLDEHQ